MIEIAYTGFMEIIVNQILIMAILIVVGYGLCKSHFIDDQVTKGISNILLRFVIPVTIMESFNQAFSVEKLKQILFVSFLSVVFTTSVLNSTQLFSPIRALLAYQLLRQQMVQQPFLLQIS